MPAHPRGFAPTARSSEFPGIWNSGGVRCMHVFVLHVLYTHLHDIAPAEKSVAMLAQAIRA
jgi:hypothetical protein